jgi:hypothetical protein
MVVIAEQIITFSVVFVSVWDFELGSGVGIAETGRVPLRRGEGKENHRQLSWAPKI